MVNLLSIFSTHRKVKKGRARAYRMTRPAKYSTFLVPGINPNCNIQVSSLFVSQQEPDARNEPRYNQPIATDITIQF